MYAAPRDGRKYELIEGVIKVTPAGMYHERISLKLGALIWVYLDSNPIGEAYGSSVGFNLPSGDLLSPDASFVSFARLPGGKVPEGFGKLSPDLAVEIVSPSDSMVDVEEKAELYLSNGTRMVWVISPRSRRATIYRPNERVQVMEDQDMLDGRDVLPGFAVKLADVLGEPPARS